VQLIAKTWAARFLYSPPGPVVHLPCGEYFSTLPCHRKNDTPAPVHLSSKNLLGGRRGGLRRLSRLCVGLRL
jgi:hypothetical protein